MRSNEPAHDAPAPLARREAGTHLAAASPLHQVLPAVEVTASVARTLLTAWLAALAWPAEQHHDILLAASEAVSNAIEHAYVAQPPGEVELDAVMAAAPGGQRRVIVVVRDHGTWRPVPAHHENRRRGIPVMRACMAAVVIEAVTDPGGEPAGTRVTLTSEPVPPRPVAAV